MAFQIKWSVEARQTFTAILDYLERTWTEKEISSFVTSVHNKLTLLGNHPAIGIIVKRRHRIHRTLVHRHVTLVYHVDESKNEIVLLTFWDNRQNPRRFQYR